MIARPLGSEPGRVERIEQIPALGVEQVREREVPGVPRSLILALVQVQVQVVIALLVPGVPLPMLPLARW